MKWTQQELEAMYREMERRVIGDPGFRERFQKDPRAVMEEVAGRELHEDLNLKLIEKDGGYAAVYIVPDFVQGEVDRSEIDDKDAEKVAAGLSFFLIVSACLAAVSVGPCGADICGGNVCGGNVCGGNLCGGDLCGGNLCAGNAGGGGGCAGNVCGGDLCGGNAGCAGYVAKGAPCAKYLGCEGYVEV